MDWDKFEQDLEAANESACKAVFAVEYPQENIEAAEMCDAGSWRCKKCPWNPLGSKEV